MMQRSSKYDKKGFDLDIEQDNEISEPLFPTS